MKNKKLVATVASLCLVVVAVVAAVVGVFAAVTQNAQGSFSVTYTAKDVYASITLRSMGPKAGQTAGTRNLTDPSSVSGATVEFAPTNTTYAAASKTVSADTYDYGWSDGYGATSAAKFYGYSIYEFAFQNKNTDSRSMTVTIADTTSIDEDLVAFYYTGTTALDNTASNVSLIVGSGSDEISYSSWSASGANPSDVRLKVNNQSGTTAIAATAQGSVSLEVNANNSIGYIFVVLVIKDAAKTIASGSGSSTIDFVLVDTANAPSNS